ncbi:MAG TPA: zinc ribbon domain-containing protein [Thermoplasmata archaeon]|nr:zinc ribbon domain-containing protein [Thermoplasmata archaeon]
MAASALSAVGAVLVFLEGVYLTMVSNAVSRLGYLSLSGVIAELAAVGIVAGMLVFVLALVAYSNPDAHTGCGIAILSVSLLSLFGGGGFLVGALLGSVGGILAILHVVPTELGGSYAPVGGWSDRSCPACGSPLAFGAVYCHTCGQPVPPATGGPAPLPIPSPEDWGRTHRTCPSCHRVVPVRSATCPGCGVALGPSGPAGTP